MYEMSRVSRYARRAFVGKFSFIGKLVAWWKGDNGDNDRIDAVLEG